MGADVAVAAALFAIDPVGLGGVALRARTGPIREAWLARVRSLLPETTTMRRVPLHIGDGRLLGGLDLAATLRSGRPIAERGLLAQADGGVLVLAMAERITADTVARLTTVLDAGELVLERDGTGCRMPARLGVIALDEGIDEERPQAALMERLAFHIDLDGLDGLGASPALAEVAAARERLAAVMCDEAILSLLCETALVLGIGSLRAEILAVRTAKACAALAGRTHVTRDDAAYAARLVLGPRATRVPDAPPSDEAPPPPVEPDRGDTPPPSPEESDGASPQEQALGDRVAEAARAAIPPGLLMQLQTAARDRGARAAAGKSGAMQAATRRGRPAGVGRGDPRHGARLNIVETLRAAAPWQNLRGRTTDRIAIRPEDFRVTRLKQRRETVALFVVDASGSLALNRLAEAKGAVELLLKDCYVRRDQVALMAFRGRGVDLLLPPTRSLTRAKRSLASLPGGGATPLASAIDAALALGDRLRRRGQTPVIVLLTDGRANVARDGTTNRPRAQDDALAAARAARLTGIRTLVIDAAQRPQAPARHLAQGMGALYLPLPHANAATLSDAVKASAIR